MTPSARIGVVVIGRNEGERLIACLRSLQDRAERIVYVDSGSTDGSVEAARALGAEVFELDTSVPFTMARGRNAGFDALTKSDSNLDFVQFVDGDCTVVPGFIEAARDYLMAHADVAAVCGRRRERHPNASIYNRLIDMEWEAPAGEVGACGGDALIRVTAFHQVGGYNPQMIAGEEPEMCCRMRLEGWKIVRLPVEMTLHDAALHRFGQWWQRTSRAGHAFAEGAYLHGRSRLAHNVREVRSIVFWGIGVPLLGTTLPVLAAIAGSGWLVLAALGVWLAYPALVLRVFLRQRAAGRPSGDAALYALSCVLGKFPNAIGLLRFLRNRHRERTLIEYK